MGKYIDVEQSKEILRWLPLFKKSENKKFTISSCWCKPTFISGFPQYPVYDTKMDGKE